jgi:ABC-type multidrug transport system ATPase subunit
MGYGWMVVHMRSGRLSGEVRLNGQPVKKQSYFRRISGYVMQDNLMLETLTVQSTRTR